MGLKIVHTDHACPNESETECIARQLKTNGFEGFANEVRALWRAYAALAECGPAKATAYPGALPIDKLHEDFGDPVTLFNSRQWLQSALEGKGGKIVGGGCGMGQADLDVVIEGYKFNVSIQPIIPRKL